MRKIINKNSTYFYSYTGLISLIFFEMILLIFLFILSRQQDLYSTTNTVVFDRTMLANANRDQILNALGHEFGHYSKEDDIDKSQDIANHTGKLLEDRTKDMVAKEATEDTLAAIRNNKNVITGEEGKKLADSIPMERREYYEVITFEGRIMVTVIGADAGMGVIYYKDSKTGEEQFGRIENIAVKYGVSTAIEGGGTIKNYSKPNTPIQDFSG